MSGEKKKIKCVYVAGPITAPTQFEREENIRKAEIVWLKCLEIGLAAHCVHSTARACFDSLDEKVFLESDFELIRRSDALVLVAGWESSRGTQLEIKLAKLLGIPIFNSVVELRDYINQADEAA